MSKPKLYLGGPMRGYVDFNQPAFMEARDHYSLAFDVIDPFMLDEKYGRTDWVEEDFTIHFDLVMAEDIAELRECTHAAFLPYWEDSEGARIEHAEALELGLKINYYTLARAKMIKATGEARVFELTGSKRDSSEGKPRPDLIDPDFLLEFGAFLGKGAAHYGDHNWALGQPTASTLESGNRHWLKLMAGLTDEEHDFAVVFAVMNRRRTRRLVKAGKLPPEMDDAKVWADDYCIDMSGNKVDILSGTNSDTCRPESPVDKLRDHLEATAAFNEDKCNYPCECAP